MVEPFNKQDKHVLTIEKWKTIAPSLKAGITQRSGGYSQAPYSTLNQGFHVGDETEDVLLNRHAVANTIEMPLDSWVIGEQVHGTRIQQVYSLDQGKGAKEQNTVVKGVDGLITDETGVLCAGLFADCVPLFFFDPVSLRVGIAHAGWKGTVGEIAGALVERFETEGSNKQDIQVVIGPSISGDVYEVDHKVIDAIASEYVDQTVKLTGESHGLLDLKQLNMEILLKYGILRHNVEVTQYGTFRDKDLFFSHRRDGGQTGRMLGFIGFST